MQTKERLGVRLMFSWNVDDLLSQTWETVKGYAKYEGSTLEKVAELRNQEWRQTLPAEAMWASDALTRQKFRIFLQLQKAIQLKASANFVKNQEERTNTENKISYSRQLYNSVLSATNVKLETFPSTIIALECLDLKRQISFKHLKRKSRFLKFILALGD